MKINTPVYYLKIVNAMDDIVKPKAERIVFGDAAQYQQLKELAIAYTATENCLALVVVYERDNVDYHCVKNGRLQTLAHTTLSYYLHDAEECENY